MEKIDIRDLRVGNWVYSSFSDIPCKVTEIRLDESGYGVCRVTCVDGYKDVASLSPIPLTKEILEKNGIKSLVLEPSGKITYSCNEPPISCTFIPDRGWYLSAGPVGSTKLPFAEISKAYYVHELQHVIRDARIEKEITI